MDQVKYVLHMLLDYIRQLAYLENIMLKQQNFTPKDVYQLNLFVKNYGVPDKCKVNDPNLAYCQIMGTHQMELDGYNTIDPYKYINERCPKQTPDYHRPNQC